MQRTSNPVLKTRTRIILSMYQSNKSENKKQRTLRIITLISILIVTTLTMINRTLIMSSVAEVSMCPYFLYSNPSLFLCLDSGYLIKMPIFSFLYNFLQSEASLFTLKKLYYVHVKKEKDKRT